MERTMKDSFLHSQEKLYREAADLLALYIQQGEVMQKAQSDGFELLARNIGKQLDRINQDFEEIRKKLFPEPSVIICHREDSVTIAESFNWHPHENVN